MPPIITFLYCPRSGDRSFAEADPCPPVISHPNGCAHIVGGAHMLWDTVRRGSWWRDDARHLMAELVRHVGGIAWDDHGDLSVVTYHPSIVRAAMDAAAQWRGAPRLSDPILWDAVASGVARIVESDDGQWRWTPNGVPCLRVEYDYVLVPPEDVPAARVLAPRWYCRCGAWLGSGPRLRTASGERRPGYDRCPACERELAGEPESEEDPT
jgi:hypothetical protein